MKLIRLLSLILGFTTLAAMAADKQSDATVSADRYPLKTCVVSDEPLGSMGEAIVYTHREAGKPDRVVRFCCEGCIDDFRQNPEKFLKKMEAAKAGTAQTKQPRKGK